MTETIALNDGTQVNRRTAEIVYKYLKHAEANFNFRLIRTMRTLADKPLDENKTVGISDANERLEDIKTLRQTGFLQTEESHGFKAGAHVYSLHPDIAAIVKNSVSLQDTLYLTSIDRPTQDLTFGSQGRIKS